MMERALRWGWLVALSAVILSLALPLLFGGDLSNSIISLVWKTEDMMECSEVMELDGSCVKTRKEFLINWAGNLKSNGQVTVFYPRTVVGLQSIVKFSKEKKVGVRVVGARHSWSRALLQIPQNTLLVSLLSKDKATTELSSVGEVEVQEGDDEVAEVEVGAGASLGQLADQCRKSGWQVASAPVLPLVTVAGVVVSLSHGAGTGRPGLADSVTALTYIDAKGQIQRLTEAEEVAVFLSSLGLLGIIVSLRVRLMPVERVRAPLQSPIDDLSLLLPRPGEALPQEALTLFEDSDYQQFFLPRSPGNHTSQSKLPATGTFWKSEPGVEGQDWMIIRLANKFLGALVGGCKAKHMIEALKVRVMGERWISTVDALHPYCDSPKFRVTEFAFPILNGKDSNQKDFLFVQRAVWDALDIADALKKKEGIDGLTDHLDVRLVAPSHIPLAPYPKIAGVWGWAGVVLAASELTPEKDWKTLVESVVGHWASYRYQDGSLLLPSPIHRPHWAKEMPTSVGEASLVEYLQEAYAKDLAKIRDVMRKILARGHLTEQESADTFATPFSKRLFNL